MSQLPGIQLQMPGAVGVTEIPYMYQETQVILPEARVDVGMSGLNLEVLGQAIGQYGSSILETYMEGKAMAKMDALEALQQKAKSSISDYADINDFEQVDRVTREYEKATQELVGFNPFDPNFTPGSRIQSRLTNSARSFQADVTDYSQGKKRGFQDTIAVENYELMSEAQKRELMETQDPMAYIESMLEDRKKMYTAMSGGFELGSKLPDTGFTTSQRNMLYKINKDYTDIMEQRDKLIAAREKGLAGLEEDRFKQMETKFQSQLLLAQTTLKTADSKIKKAGELDPRSEEAVKLRAEAHELAIIGIRQRNLAMSAIAESRRKQAAMQDIAGQLLAGQFTEESPFEITEEFPEIPELDDPASIEAMTYLVNTGVLSNETVRAMGDAFNDERVLLDNKDMDGVKIQQSMENQQKSYISRQLESTVSETEARLTQIESRQKAIKDSPEGATAAGRAKISALEDQKTRLMGSLRDQLLRDVVSPLIPKNMAQNIALNSFMRRQDMPGKRVSTLAEADEFRQIMSNPTPFNIDFSNESFKVMQGALYGGSQIPLEIYRKATDEVNRIESKFSDMVSGTSATYGSRLERQRETARDLQLFLTNRSPEGRPFSSEKIVELSILAATARLSKTGLDENILLSEGLPPLAEALAIIEENDANPNSIGRRIPLSPAMIQNTSWYTEAIEMAMQEPSVEAAMAKFDEIMGKLVGRNEAGLAWHDLARVGPEFYQTPTDNPSVGFVTELVKDTQVPPELSAVAFLGMQRDARNTILGKLRAVPNKDAVLESTIGYLEYLNRTYEGTGSPGEFIISQRLTGITPFIVEEAEEFIRVAQSYDPEREPPKNETTEQQIRRAGSTAFMRAVLGDDETSVFEAALLEVRRLNPSVITDERLEGMRRILRNPNDDFTKTLILYATAEAWDNKELKYNWKKKDLAQNVATRLRETWLPNRSWDDAQNKFVYRKLERTEETATSDAEIHISGNITASSGLEFGPKHRLFIVGNSTQPAYDENASQTQANLILGQVARTHNMTDRDYKLLKDDPIGGLVFHGVVANRRVSDNQLKQLVSPDSNTGTAAVLTRLVTSATAGMPKDNYTIMAAIGAIAELDINETDLTRARTFVFDKTREIRRALETGSSENYRTRIVERPTNNDRGSNSATIQVVRRSGDKDVVISEFQPNTNSVSDILPTMEDARTNTAFNQFVSSLTDSQLKGLVFSDKNTQRSRDVAAVSYLQQDQKKKMPRVEGPMLGGRPSGLLLGEITSQSLKFNYLESTYPAYWKEELSDGTFAIKRGTWTYKAGNINKWFVGSDSTTVYLSRPEGSLEEALEGPYGLREDGTQKGSGWMGELRNANGDIVTEYTITVDLFNQQMTIPSIVPTLTDEEIQQVLDASANGEYPPVNVEAKAIRHAQKRLMENKSPFADQSVVAEGVAARTAVSPARRRMSVSENLKSRKANPELWAVYDAEINRQASIRQRRTDYTSVQDINRWENYRQAIMRGEMSPQQANELFEAGYPAPIAP